MDWPQFLSVTGSHLLAVMSTSHGIVMPIAIATWFNTITYLSLDHHIAIKITQIRHYAKQASDVVLIAFRLKVRLSVAK